MKLIKKYFKKRRQNLSIFILLILIVGVVIAVASNKQSKNSDIEASSVGCPKKTSRSVCVSSCSPIKNGVSYKCVWGKNGCYDSSKVCGETYKGPVCPANVNAKNCTVFPLKNGYVKCHFEDNDAENVLSCCLEGYTVKDTGNGLSCVK